MVSPGTPVSSTNKTDHHDIAEDTEILLKVALNIINPQWLFTDKIYNVLSEDLKLK